MNGSADIWQLLAGLGFFLYGMHLIDATIRGMEGRGFKVFLKKYTGTRAGALLSGFVVTAVLQSSSIVNLLLLSFSGAGLVGLRNALGVVLGSNIGGTVNSWLVAVLGFKVDLGAYALALVAIAGSGLFLLHQNTRWHRVLRFCMGLGLVLLGLDFARTSMDGALSNVNLSEFAGYSSIVFLLIGFIITAIVQTSAATVMIVLSALYAGAIPLEMAVSIVLGAELGTTVKIVLGSVKGAAIKRRIASGNLMMNVASTAIGFIFLPQVIMFLQFLGLQDPLFLLVAFQSAVNIAGSVLFFFLLDPLAAFLNRFFSDDTRLTTQFLGMASEELPQPAIELLEKEVRYFLLRVLSFNLRFFGIEAAHTARKYLHDEMRVSGAQRQGDVQYHHLKESEDEMIAFCARLRKSDLSTGSAIRLNSLLLAVRNGMYSAKALKDIEHNIRTLRNSAEERDFAIYQHFREEMKAFMDQWLALWKSEEHGNAAKLDQLLAAIEKDHSDDAAKIYTSPGVEKASTLLNVNREMYNACKSLIAAIRELSGDPSQQPLPAAQ